jgi:hypothetical protein
MNDQSFQLPPVRGKIATLVDHDRDGRFVFAFCPICDHVEEAGDDGGGREQAASDSVAKIKIHIRRVHPAQPVKIKISVVREKIS